MPRPAKPMREKPKAAPAVSGSNHEPFDPTFVGLFFLVIADPDKKKVPAVVCEGLEIPSLPDLENGTFRAFAALQLNTTIAGWLHLTGIKTTSAKPFPAVISRTTV